MDNLSVALKHVSQAIDLESSGFQLAAFSKYIQSLQALVFCLNNFYTSSGFDKVIEKKKEVAQVLCMIHECSDRISVIINDQGKQTGTPFSNHSKQDSNSELQFPTKVSAFENLQRENMQLFKSYKIRLERAEDKYTKTNLALEFQRRLSENAILAKKKYDLAVKKLQKERVQLMEDAIRKLFESNVSQTEKEKEKRQLYDKVLLYVRTETWPCTWKLNSYDLSALEIVEKVFYKILRFCEHPLTQWLILTQTNIRRKIDSVLKDYYEYVKFFPDLNVGSRLSYSVEETAELIIINCRESDSLIRPIQKKYIQDTLVTISSEVQNVIEDTVEIFYLVYRSLLPEDSEAACYHIAEKYFLKPLWSNLFSLFRILNLASEYKVSETMCAHPSPLNCGVANYSCQSEVDEDFIPLFKSMLQNHSIIYKLKILVQISQKICEPDVFKNSSQMKLGTDDMLPLLCSIIVQSKLPELVSECDMLEHLFDMRYMLGEEGFALASFQTALKCIEIRKLTECDA